MCNVMGTPHGCHAVKFNSCKNLLSSDHPVLETYCVLSICNQMEIIIIINMQIVKELCKPLAH